MTCGMVGSEEVIDVALGEDIGEDILRRDKLLRVGCDLNLSLKVLTGEQGLVESVPNDCSDTESRLGTAVGRRQEARKHLHDGDICGVCMWCVELKDMASLIGG